MYPVIIGIEKLDSRPPIWFLELEGGLKIKLTTVQLITYEKFRRAFADEHNRIFAPMKKQDWSAMVYKAMENCVIIPS